jgi:predicted AlkP superfamily phosphohydrolase/phosphomutase
MKAERRVLMLGFDAAEQTLIRSLIARGRLPVLARLMRDGCTGLLSSPAAHYTGAVWPTFYTGQELPWHGIYHGKQWRPARMCCVAPVDSEFPARPFWESFSGSGIRSCVVDIPLILGKPRPIDGVYLGGWATHDPMVNGSTPSNLWRALRREFGARMMPSENFGPQNADSLLQLCGELLRATEQLQRIALSLLQRQTWDFACIAFGAAHRAGHYLWDLGEVQDPEQLDARQRATLEGAVERVYESIDHAFGQLLEGLGSEVVVLIFSLHGMGPNPGWSDLVPAILDARTAALGRQTVRKGLLYSLRQRLATSALRPLVRAVPLAIAARLVPLWSARMFDWRHTPFFPIPMDLAGYLRVNLKGREREGIVERGAGYEQVCSELETFFSALRDTATRKPVVRATLRAAASAAPEAPQREGLPDLIIEWGDLRTRDVAALTCDALPAFSYPVPRLLPSGRSGNHKHLGWFVATGPGIPAGTQLPVHDILDLAPTAMHFLGLELPPSLHGRRLPFEAASA